MHLPCIYAKHYSDSGAVTYPALERLPHRQPVAHVSEDPQNDDAGLEVCDSGLGREKRAKVTNSTRSILNRQVLAGSAAPALKSETFRL